MPSFAKKFRHDLAYRLTLFFFNFFNVIPRDLGLFLGAWLGFLASVLLKKDMHKSRRLIRLAFSDRIEPNRDESLAREMFINFGKNFVDVMRIGKHYDRDLAPHIKVEGIEHFDRVYNRGKGVIGITGHIGNFELLAAWFAKNGYKASAIGRELYEKRLNRLLIANRESTGLVNIDTNDSPRKILRLLREGYILGVLIDTDSYRVRSKLIPVFGRLSNTPVGQSVLGLRTGAGFVPVACIREGRGYRIIIKPEVTIERTEDFEQDLYNITEKCTRELERIISVYKSQWIWLHNRWHTRPEANDRIETNV